MATGLRQVSEEGWSSCQSTSRIHFVSSLPHPWRVATGNAAAAVLAAFLLLDGGAGGPSAGLRWPRPAEHAVHVCMYVSMYVFIGIYVFTAVLCCVVEEGEQYDSASDSCRYLAYNVVLNDSTHAVMLNPIIFVCCCVMACFSVRYSVRHSFVLFASCLTDRFVVLFLQVLDTH